MVTIEVQTTALPPIAGLGLRLYRGPNDLPGMLRAYQAANDADGLESRFIARAPDGVRTWMRPGD